MQDNICGGFSKDFYETTKQLKSAQERPLVPRKKIPPVHKFSYVTPS